jgi:hypothetical protein
LDYIFRTVAQLPGVKLQTVGVPIKQPAQEFGLQGPCQVAIFAVHSNKTPAKRVYPGKITENHCHLLGWKLHFHPGATVQLSHQQMCRLLPVVGHCEAASGLFVGFDK